MASEDDVIEAPNIHPQHSTKVPEFWNLETNRKHSLWEQRGIPGLVWSHQLPFRLSPGEGFSHATLAVACIHKVVLCLLMNKVGALSFIILTDSRSERASHASYDGRAMEFLRLINKEAKTKAMHVFKRQVVAMHA